MNRVTPLTPMDDILALIAKDGYVLMENALDSVRLAKLNAAYDRQLALHPAEPGALRVEIPRVIERDPVFEDLMDQPRPFAVAHAIIGADIELATSGELDHKLPRTKAYISWHNDFQWMVNVPFPRQNFWVRCTYFLDEVTADMGPFTLIPGSHKSDRVCPKTLCDESGQPLPMPGQVGITGPAGSCLINNTEIWHTNWPNDSDRARRLIMLLYKHAWMKQWQLGYQTTPEFAARQSDPLRRQLTGACCWHKGAETFPANQLTV